MRSPFLLSHHPRSELDRTYDCAGVHLCARCLGTYPTLAMALVAQFRHHTVLSWRFEVLAGVLFMLPALIDWSLGRLRPRQGNNLVRTGSGVLLGLALGRTLYVHLHHPYPRVLLVQAVVVTGVAVPVMLLALRRRWRELPPA